MLPSVRHLAHKGAAQALPAGPANITPRHAALQCLHSAGAHALHVGWRQRRQAQGPDWAACAPKGRGDLRNVREQVRLDTCLGMRIDACSHGLCRHVFRHVFRHAFGHVFRRVFRPVLGHVFEHVFRHLFTPVFTGTASSRTRSGRSCCQRSRSHISYGILVMAARAANGRGVGHNYTGHNYIGHDYIGRSCCQRSRRSMP